VHFLPLPLALLVERAVPFRDMAPHGFDITGTGSL
jgi:hypothetical protein